MSEGNKKVKQLKIRDVLVVASLSVLAVFFTASNATAATTKASPVPKANVSPNTLKISPLRTDVVVNAGETKMVTVTVENITTEPIVLKPIENDFVAGDDKGTPAIILDENSYAPSHSLKRFMKPLSNVTVPAKSSTEVKVPIAVPANAKAGGYFGALRFVPASAEGSLNVSVNASVVSLILMTVPGDLEEKLVLENFDVRQNGGAGSNFRNPDNLSLYVKFKNMGNVQVAPFGQINVQKGEKVVYTSKFNNKDQRDNVLPDSSRKWDVPLKNFGKFGKYTVTGTFAYGTTNETIEVKKTVWIVPTMYIIAAIGALLVLVLIIVLIVALIRAKHGGRSGGSRHRY